MIDSYEVKKLFEGVIPERVEEVYSLMEKHGIEFRLLDDDEGCKIQAAFNAIQYTKRAMHQVWLFGIAGMQSLHCYASHLHIIQSLGLNLSPHDLESIPGQAEENAKFSNLLEHLKQLKTAYSIHDFMWPEEVPNPDDGKPLGIEPSVVYDLTCMATSYIFLHEMKHALIYAESDESHTAIDEEYECDKFAKQIMLSEVDRYALMSGYPADKVRTKRSMGIALASAFILATTARENIGGSNTHPSVHGRWLETLQSIKLPPNDYFWLYFTSIALAMLRYLDIEISERAFSSHKELCFELINDLQNGI